MSLSSRVIQIRIYRRCTKNFSDSPKSNKDEKDVKKITFLTKMYQKDLTDLKYITK
jgi:hypothetical protein